MAAAGRFVRERIPVPCSVPEAGRLILELVSGFAGCDAEPAGPMTFRVVRRYRPTWATATAFLVFPLFIRQTEVCRVAVIEARMGAELLLEGTLEEDLHAALAQLGRIPDAARVSTLGPRPVPQGLSAAPARPAAPLPPPPSSPPPEMIDLRDRRQGSSAQAQRDSRDQFSDLIPPPLLPPAGASADHSAYADPAPSRPSGPAPAFEPMHARQSDEGNGSNGSSSNRRPSAFRSDRDSVQSEDLFASGSSAPPRARPGVPAPPDTVAAPAVTPMTVTVTVDSGEQSVLDGHLIIGRAPVRGAHEQSAKLLKIEDPSLSVSKTHLMIETDGDGLWVTDRNSTNGTWIDEGRGALRPVPANERTAVPPGARVLFGERVLTFTRQPR